MNEEMKPCPFCGGEAKVKAANEEYGLTIWCQCKCGARTMGYCPKTDNEDTTIENIEFCKYRAIAAWNKRTNDRDCERRWSR